MGHREEVAIKLRGMVLHAGHPDFRQTFEEAAALLEQPTDLHARVNSGGNVVVGDYYWQPMDTCPRGVKVQLLTMGGVAVYGTYRDGDDGFTGWAPLPKRRD